MKLFVRGVFVTIALGALSVAPAAICAQSAEAGKPAAKPTPRLANGKPNLTGFYMVTFDPAKTIDPAPPYKPDALTKVRELDMTKTTSDPMKNCQPAGVPRIGPPREIFQSPTLTVIVYEGASGKNFRLIPTDGRPHRTDVDASYFGDSVGHWEGDTLVVDVKGLDDSTWLGPNGWFHSQSVHVVERFTREGDMLHYEATVEDPEVLAKPWTMAARTVSVNPDPDNDVYKVVPCNGRDF